MRIRFIALVSALLIACAAAAGAQGAGADSATPVRKQLDRWLAAFNTGDRAEIERFLASDYPARLPKVANEMANRSRSGGYDLRKIEGSTDTTITGLVQQRDSDEFVKFTLEVEPAPPHRIASIKLLPVPRPAEFPIPRVSETDAIRELQALAQRRVASDQFSGTVLVAKRDTVLYQAAFGLADRVRKTPNELDTRFRLGSMNKMFTGVAVVQLVQAGKVKLDAPLGQYVPDYPNADIARKVTIHQLLTHTGGTGDIFGPEFTANRLQLKALDDYVKLYGKRAPGFEPGSRFEYSNYGYILLGVVIERVTGGSYYAYIDKHVYRVAGMTASGSLSEDEVVAKRSIGYTRQLTIEEWRPNTDTLPYRGMSAGGGYSTVADLLRFANALLDHKLLDARHTTLLFGGKVDGPFGQYAYGFGDTRARGGGWSSGGWVGHSGGAPGMNGELLIYPDDGYTVVALANIDPPAASTVSQFIGARLPLRQVPQT